MFNKFNDIRQFNNIFHSILLHNISLPQTNFVQPRIAVNGNSLITSILDNRYIVIFDANIMVCSHIQLININFNNSLLFTKDLQFILKF